ncbi:RNA polymerase sigma factor [Paenibacillus xerothermodurans]|uniref:RNA polymerase sigma factor n=1 Tax=Paenibacillus xerothermodurans TaxID=1977292 RepID=UPI00140299DB|nr:sigma-70 family RNA polymerase sigma factor [Paenibacillus xerothermodurans]
MREWFYLFHNDFDELEAELQEIIYHSYRRLVFKDIFYLTGDHALTEDIIQEAFSKIISISRKQKVTHTAAWIRQVTRNLALNVMKKNKKELQLSSTSLAKKIEDNMELAMQQISVANEVENNIRNESLQQAIVKLNPHYRNVITLFYINELSYKEIAVILGLSENAVTQKLERARKKLLHQFQQIWKDQ